MRPVVACALVLVAGLLLSGDLDAGNLEPPGPPAPTMKALSQVEPRTPISSLPFTIAAPGSYYLTGDLTGVSGQAGITITSSFVTLDLNGFSLVGVAGSLNGINATVAGTKTIAIRNGVVRGWGGNGISVFLASEVHAENLRLDSNGSTGLAVGSRSIVRDTTSTGNGLTGIEVAASSSVIGCTASSNSQGGIVAGSNGVVSSSTASNNGTIGIQLFASGIATDCIAQQNNTGITLSGAGRVLHSTARQNVVGINGAADGASIEDCTADGNTDDGIRIGTRGLLRGNLSRNNTNDGIHVTGFENRIEDNQSYTNTGGAGIRVDGTNNLVVKNSVSFNGVEYNIALGNKVGTISTDPTTAGPWANFDL